MLTTFYGVMADVGQLQLPNDIIYCCRLPPLYIICIIKNQSPLDNVYIMITRGASIFVCIASFTCICFAIPLSGSLPIFSCGNTVNDQPGRVFYYNCSRQDKLELCLETQLNV